MAIYFIPGFEQPAVHISLLMLVLIISIPVSSKFEKIYGKDPGQCVIDEVVGTWISLLFVPKQLWIILTAFFIWRVLDIIKPFPARKAEKLNGGLGIVLDDVISGIYSLAAIHIIILIIK